MYVTLSQRVPEVDENFRILLLIDNKAQEQSLEREKQQLLEFLRHKLQNHHISLETKLEASGANAFLYTDKEKFLKLAEKNPHLLTLKNKLNLDFDF